jgi:hypothetical protein
MAVNRYYDYYETWGAAVGDLTSQGINTAPLAPGSGLPSGARLGPDGGGIFRGLAQQEGYTLRLAVAGHRSHLTRAVYVYLPPQYFQSAYRGYRWA